MTFLDDYSRYMSACYIELKSDVVDTFIGYKSMKKNQLSAKIKCIRTDNSGEYINNHFAEVCRKTGIVNQATVPYSPQKTERVGRLSR